MSLSFFCECFEIAFGLPSQLGLFWEPEISRKNQGMGGKCVGGMGMEGEWREGRKVFLREMCLQGNFAKSGLCSFSFRGKKKPSSFFSLILPIIFSYCPCYITSQLSSEADPVEYLSLHWWIARVLWADLDGGGISLHPLWGREKEGQGRYEPERSVSTFPSCHGNGWGWPTFLTMLGFACLKYQQVTYFLELGWDSENT